jgi:hypothetical protein
MLNRSSVVVTPRQPFLEWLHTSDPTSADITLEIVSKEPAIYLIPECHTSEEVSHVLHELCEEIFTEQLDGWYRDTTTWPTDRSFDVFCHWFDYRHHSVLIDLCEETLIDEY